MSCKIITREGIEYYDAIEIGEIFEVQAFETLESGLEFVSDAERNIPYLIVGIDGVVRQPNINGQFDAGTRLLILRSWADEAYSNPEICGVDACYFLPINDPDPIHDANGFAVPADIRFHHRHMDRLIISADDLCEGFNLPLLDKESLMAQGYKPDDHYLYLHFSPKDYMARSLYFTERGLARFASLPGHSSIAVWMAKMIDTGSMLMTAE